MKAKYKYVTDKTAIVLSHIGSLKTHNPAILRDVCKYSDKYLYLEISKVNHVKAIEFMMISDVLVYFSTHTPITKLLPTPGKIWEYAGTKKHILGIISPGHEKLDSGTEIISQFKTTHICLNDKKDIKKELNILYDEIVSNRKKIKAPTTVKKFLFGDLIIS